MVFRKGVLSSWSWEKEGRALQGQPGPGGKGTGRGKRGLLSLQTIQRLRETVVWWVGVMVVEMTGGARGNLSPVSCVLRSSANSGEGTGSCWVP